MLNIDEVARHYGLRPDTVRRKVRAGEVEAIRLGRVYRLAWPDIWACEGQTSPEEYGLCVGRLPASNNVASARKLSSGNWVRRTYKPSRSVYNRRARGGL